MRLLSLHSVKNPPPPASRRNLGGWLLMCLLFAVSGCTAERGDETARPGSDAARTAAEGATDASAADAGTVTLSIESVDADPLVVEVPGVATGTTLETVMRSLDGVDVDITGSGTTAFVNSIEGKATGGNEGWTFQVDGEPAKQGIGSTVLDPPVEIEWSYGSFSETVQ